MKRTTPHPLCRVEMLGGLRIRQGDRLITRFPTYKTGALLAYLAYFPRRDASREMLIEMFWPDHSSERARNNLSAALSALRPWLEPSGTPAGTALIADRHTVRINPDLVDADVHEFLTLLRNSSTPSDEEEQAERLTAAVALWNGELLPGCYEDWIAAEREHLTESYLQGLRGLVRYHAKHKAPQNAIEYAQRAVSADPIREEAHRDLIRLFLATGQVSAALQQYREMETALTKALGETPSAASRQLLQEIETRLQAEPETKPAPPSSRREPPAPQPAPTPVGALPVTFTRFFGRKAEMRRLTERLLEPQTRLLTLFGMGGAGKTRLAQEAAAQLQPDFSGAVWFVSLVDLSDASHLPRAIATALSLPPSPQKEPLDQIVEVLTGKPALLVLDNFEHLVEAGSACVTTLLSRLPELKLLVTSRQLLGLTSEHEFALDPMAVPGTAATLEHLTECESVQLFQDRARITRPDFQLSASNAEAVAALCNRLEGLPLALELAAARSSLLSPEQMLKQLEDRFRLLVSRKQDLPERHRTLRATLEWSYALLEPDVRDFFARLAVFRGGWTIEAAEAICAGQQMEDESAPQAQSRRPTPDPRSPDAVLDHLERLRECSLLQTVESGGGIRFRMLETVREFAALHLAPEEQSERRRLHRDYFLSFAEEVKPDLIDEATEAGGAAIEQELENLRAALALDCPAPADLEKRFRLANILSYFWKRRGLYREGRQWLEPAEEEGLPIAPRTRAEAVHAAGRLALLQGDYSISERLLQHCLALYRALEDADEEAKVLMNLGILAVRRGDAEAASACFEESMGRWRERGNWTGVADTLVWLGTLAWRRGDLAEAQRLFGEGHALYLHEKAFTRCLDVLNNLGVLAHEQGQSEKALAFYERCLEVHRQAGNRPGVARTLNNRGNILRELGRVEEAEAALQESLTLRREMENPETIALTLNTLGLTHCARGDYDAARSCFMESWLFYQQRADREGLAYTLTGLAEIALGEEHPALAARLLAQADRERSAVNLVLPPSDRRDWNRVLTRTQAALPESEFQAAWRIGNAAPLALEPSNSLTPGPSPTRREG